MIIWYCELCLDAFHLSLFSFPLQILTRDILGFYANKHREKIEFIYVCYNNLNDIEAGMFEDFANVRNINFGVNLLETIKRSYFGGIDKIDFLNFQSNLIHTIERGSFDELSQLEYMYLDDNCLTHLPERLFHNNGRIRNIFLQQNRLVHLGSSFMRPNQKLFSLNVAENRLQDISNLFRFKNLISLIASNNKLNSIRIDEDVSDGVEMTSLNVDSTGIENLTFVRRLKRLRELYAGNNLIKSLDLNDFHENRGIAYISLQSNPLTAIVNVARVKEILPNLRVVDIAGSSLAANCDAIRDLMTQLDDDKSLNFNLNSKSLGECLRVWLLERDGVGGGKKEQNV